MVMRRMVALAAAGAIAVHYPAGGEEGPGARAVNCTSANCASVPPPMELNRLNAAIDAEAQERRQADTLLFGEIASLRAKVEEPSITGRWAFTGTQTCLVSTSGFNPATLLPLVSSPPPPQGMIFSISTTTASGVSEFKADGTGTTSTTFHTIGHPVDFLPGTGGFRTGAGQIATRESTFTYEVQGDAVLIDEVPAPAYVTKGTNVGASITGLDTPRFAGKISRDRKTLSVMGEDLVVERNVIASPGAAQQTTERVCQRVRTLYRIH